MVSIALIGLNVINLTIIIFMLVIINKIKDTVEYDAKRTLRKVNKFTTPLITGDEEYINKKNMFRPLKKGQRLTKED